MMKVWIDRQRSALKFLRSDLFGNRITTIGEGNVT